MGESSSACLVRSMSQPSQECTEEDPLHALTTSVSFGRFMSESLAWEKWSSFTHNRYLEEVEKYARPGSVAEKKAYFEAQHKKAAAKKAALLLEQQNAAVAESSDLNVKNQNNDDSTVNSELTGTSSYVGIEETQREEGELNVTAHTIDESRRESEFTENGSYWGTEEAQGKQGHLNVTNPDIGHCTMRFELPENSNHMSTDDEVQGNEGDNTTTCGRYPIHEEINSETFETENSFVQSYPVENEAKSLNQPENVVVELSENIPQLNKKTQEKTAGMVGDTLLSMKKKPKKPLTLTTRLTNKNESSKFKSRIKPETALQPIVTDKSAPASRKDRKVLIDKKQSNPRSHHMSIKFSSHPEETKKTLSPILEKILNSSRIVRSITKTFRDSKIQQTSTLAPVSGISKRPSETPQRENRRARTKLDQSFCRSRKEEGESLSHSGNLKLIKHGNIACSPTVFSPFSLRSEERAAKRKQFFQKLEEKLNTKEAEKEQRQVKSKEKATTSSKVLISRTKPNPRIHHERESSSNQMKKEKATSSSKVLTPRAKPNSSIHHERELSSNQMKKEKATSSSKELMPKAKPNELIHQSRAESNATIHRERESSSNQMKKMLRQPCSPKFSQKPMPVVQDNKPRQPWRLSGKPVGSKDVNLPNHFPVKGRSDNPKSFICESMPENASPNIQV